MSWYKICSRCDTKTHYDIVCDWGVYRCRCGRKYRCVIPDWPVNGGKYEPPYWAETFSWKRLKDWVTGK